MTTGRLGVSFIAATMVFGLILIAAACNKKSETTPSSEAAPQTVSAASQPPSAPARPVPLFSAREFNRTIRNRRLHMISRSETSSAHFLPVWMHAVIQ